METLEWNSDMMISAVVLAVTFIAIFTEEIHKIHRVKCAMAGAAAMIVVGQFIVQMCQFQLIEKSNGEGKIELRVFDDIGNPQGSNVINTNQVVAKIDLKMEYQVTKSSQQI